MASWIEYFGVSIKGRRDSNQDAFTAEKLSEYAWLFAVADGMGGAKGGEIASKLVLQTLFCELKNQLGSEKRVKNLRLTLNQAFKKANLSLKEKQEKEPELNGMGTTLTAMLIVNDNYIIGHIGDSRGYFIRGNEISQITKDHTYIQDYLDNNKGQLTREITDKYSHYLLKAMDGNEIDPDFYPSGKNSALLPGDGAFLLCSDGLILDKVHTNHHLFRNYITGTKDCETAARQLAHYAYHKGSQDNITALVTVFENFRRERLNLQTFPENNTKKSYNHSLQLRKPKKTLLVLGSILFVSIIYLVLKIILSPK